MYLYIFYVFTIAGRNGGKKRDEYFVPVVEQRARQEQEAGVGWRATRRSGRCLGVLLGCGLCTWCIQPIFNPV